MALEHSRIRRGALKKGKIILPLLMPVQPGIAGLLKLLMGNQRKSAKKAKRKKGFQRKTLKAFIISGWLTRIRT